MKAYKRPLKAKDLRERGRIVLAHGEVTGHAHEVVPDVCDDVDHALPAADYFEEPDSGRRVLLVMRPCILRHQEHDPISLDPARPVQARQGDVLLNPIGPGAYEVICQSEFDPTEIRQVQD